MAVLIETQFLPPVSAFTYFAGADTLFIEVHENYQKRSYRNRCNILSSSGVMPVSIPLQKGKNNQCNIREVKIAYDQPWHITLIKRIQSAYGKSPYFEHYFESLYLIFKKKPVFLIDLNMECMVFLIHALQWEVSMDFTKTYDGKCDKKTCDLRNQFSPLGNGLALWPEKLKYTQVFENKFGFTPRLSILDMVFNMGPETGILLEQNKIDCTVLNDQI